MYRLESHLPIPESRPGPKTRYPFGTMAVGESFLVDRDAAYRARNAVNAYKGKHPGWNYTARLEADGLRIWRTA